MEHDEQKVLIVALAGHGDDQTPPNTLTMNVYRDKVIDVVNSVQGQVILVGHSMAGMIISAVTEKIQNKINRLVYLAAYLPADGQSLLDLANTDNDLSRPCVGSFGRSSDHRHQRGSDCFRFLPGCFR